MNFSVLPQPRTFHLSGDTPVFFLNELCNLRADAASATAESDLLAFLEKLYALTPLIGSGKDYIFLSVDPALPDREGYRLTVQAHKVTVTGADASGVFYGVQTLKQLLLQGDRALPALSIDDAPRFSHRAFMLDLCRHYFAPDAIKLFLDAMALHKLNVLHLHLSDDQGWRVEIYSRLLLAQIGGFRTDPAYGGKLYGGFLTKADVDDLVAYAAARHITIVPEIDLPGHSIAALAAYPALSCDGKERSVTSRVGIHRDILCAGKESTYDFVFSVLDEVCEMFPSGMVHIGGDEVPLHNWKQCPDCQKRIRDEGLADEKALYEAFMRRVAEHLTAKGQRVFAWHNKELSPDFSGSIVLHHWNRPPETDAPYIDANWRVFYFDHSYGTLPLSAVYDYEPTAEGKTPVGLEACLWTEFIDNLGKAGTQTFPRLGAFCETAWSEKENKDYARFLEKLPAYERLLQTLPAPYTARRQANPHALKKLLLSLREGANWVRGALRPDSKA